MLNDKINTEAGVPVLPEFAGLMGSDIDPFAFARRLHTAMWVFDIDNSRVLYANAAACELWDATSEKELQDRELGADMSRTVASRLAQYQADFVESDASFNEMWTLYPKGVPRSVMVVFSGLYLPDGRMAMLCEAIGDTIDEPNNLRSAEALLHTDVMISLYEMDGPAVYMNPAARNTTSTTLTHMSEKFVSEDDYARLAAGLEATGQHRMIAKVMTGAGTRWHDVSAKTCSDAVTGKPVILETAIDVSELKIARDKARYLADRDQLTGCYNRTFLAQYISLLKGFPCSQSAILSLDVDNFKQINDRFGHEMGDLVLKKIVQRALRKIRSSDVIIRLGGDEFVIVLEHTPDEDELKARIEVLQAEITTPMTFEATKIPVTVSMGVTTFSSETLDFTAIMREADVALYASKQAGRNCVTLFTDEMGSERRRRSALEVELKRSIEDQDFMMHLQPRIDLMTGKVVSAEALLRWQHPTRGLIMPGDFIGVCEETGMIEDLGQLILAMGRKHLMQLKDAGHDIDLSINISPRQFQDKRLVQTLESFARDPNFPTDRFELELTEGVLIGDLDEIEAKLRDISQMGYRIAIDDFGTGYSNLSYISQFPLDCLKIDQSFMAQLPKSGPIINLILTLAKQINATVVAEGIETIEQLNWLAQQGCDQAQGYLLSYPVPMGEFLKVIETLQHPLHPRALASA